MEVAENDSRMTIALPADLKRDLKVSAALNDRPLSKEVLHRLKLGMAKGGAGDAPT